MRGAINLQDKHGQIMRILIGQALDLGSVDKRKPLRNFCSDWKGKKLFFHSLFFIGEVIALQSCVGFC